MYIFSFEDAYSSFRIFQKLKTTKIFIKDGLNNRFHIQPLKMMLWKKRRNRKTVINIPKRKKALIKKICAM